MLTLAQARAQVAALLSGVDGIAVRAQGPLPSPESGDGWVVVGPMTLGQFSGCEVELSARIVMHPDEATAEEVYTGRAVELLRAVTSSDLGARDVTVTPAAFIVANTSTPLYCAEITLTMEVAENA